MSAVQGGVSGAVGEQARQARAARQDPLGNFMQKQVAAQDQRDASSAMAGEDQGWQEQNQMYEQKRQQDIALAQQQRNEAMYGMTGQGTRFGNDTGMGTAARNWGMGVDAGITSAAAQPDYSSWPNQTAAETNRLNEQMFASSGMLSGAEAQTQSTRENNLFARLSPMNAGSDRPTLWAASGQTMNDVDNPGDFVNFGEPVKPTPTSDAVLDTLVSGMRNPRPPAGLPIMLDDFGQPMGLGQAPDADAALRGRKATFGDLGLYQKAEEDIAGLKFNKIFKPDDPNHFVIGSFMDGTWNKRGDGGLTDTRPGIDSTNVGLLQWMSEGQSDNLRSKYFSGVGTDWYTKHFGGATGAGMTLRVEEAYKWTADQVNGIYANNQNATFDFIALGFSRGSVEARMLLRTIDSRGIPDFASAYEVSVGEGRTETRYGRHIVAPGQANLNAVIFDSVSTGGGDFYNLDLPERAQVYHPIARDEMRGLFPSAPLAKQGDAWSSSWYQAVLPGDHSDLGNNHDRGGLGDWNLKLAHQFMTQQLGLPLQDIPSAYTPIPGNMWIHDMTGKQGVPPSYNNPFARSQSPRYTLPPLPQSTYKGN